MGRANFPPLAHGRWRASAASNKVPEPRQAGAIEPTDIGALSAAQAQETGAAMSAVKLIQDGGATISMAGLSGNFLGGTIVQNTLNNQHIESRTLINASVNSAGLLSTLQFHGALSDALARATGP